VRLEAGRLEGHRHRALDMVETVEAVHRRGIFPVGGFTVIVAAPVVRREIGVGELVVLGLARPAQRNPEAPYSADPFDLQIALLVLVEELVVPQFVGGDFVADLFEHRLLSRVGEGRVHGRGAAFDDAAGDQLADPRAAHGPGHAGGQFDVGGKILEGGRKIEGRIGHFGPAAQGVAVLDLFLGPPDRSFGKLGIVLEHFLKIPAVIAAVLLHKACRLDDLDQIGINLARVEVLPGNIVERPVLHRFASNRRQSAAFTDDGAAPQSARIDRP